MNKEQIQKACDILTNKFKKEVSCSTLISNEQADSVWLIIATKKMPEAMKMKPIRIPIKHQLFAAPEICLFTKDPQREYKDLVKTLNLPISKVIGVSKLKTKYNSHEAKRNLITLLAYGIGQLCNSFDLFLADERILPLLPKLLGKSFFEKKRIPVPINLKSNVDKDFSEIRTSTFLNLNIGCCNSIRIGKLSFTSQQITENIMFAIEPIISKIPGKWTNIQSIHLKTSDSIALPLFNSLPNSSEATFEPVIKAVEEVIAPADEIAVPQVSKKSKKQKTNTVKNSTVEEVVTLPLRGPTVQPEEIAVETVENEKKSSRKRSRRASSKKETEIVDEVVVDKENTDVPEENSVAASVVSTLEESKKVAPTEKATKKRKKVRQN